MCIYCGTKKYRKIYENHYGPIPREDNGRTYEIHHIDGDHSNNNPDNLRAVTIQEHYDIHYSQSDFGACFKMAPRLKMTLKEISLLCSLAQKKRVEDGSHNFLGPELNKKRINDGSHNFLGPELNQKRINDGSHHFLMREDGTSLGKYANQKSIEYGTNKFLDEKWQKEKTKKAIKKGTHNFLQKVKCPHCDKTGVLGPMKRFHFGKCKFKLLVDN